jgi:uncharacterized protein YggU (UPF0235/DUF167 family)
VVSTEQRCVDSLPTRRGNEPHAARAQAVSAPSQPPWLRLGERYFTVELSVRPGSGRAGFARSRPTGPVVGLNSAPEKGRANRELVEFIAQALEVPTASVSIIKGQGARHKVIRVETSFPQDLAAKLVGLANRG